MKLHWVLPVTQTAHLNFSQAKELLYRSAYIIEGLSYNFPQPYLVLMKGQKKRKTNLIYWTHLCNYYFHYSNLITGK